MLDWLLTPFALPFMATALSAMLVLSVAAGPVSVLVNLRGLEFISDALVHAVFPGIVIGFAVAGEPGLIGFAVVAAVIAAVVLTVISRRGVADDSAIAIVLTGMFSVGILVVSGQNNYFGQLQSLLFGRLFTVTPDALLALSAIALAAAALVGLSWKRQLFRAFDREGAVASGYRGLGGDILLNVAIALIVVSASTAVGNLLILAVLVIPGAVARLITRRLGLLIPLAVAFAGLASWLGLCLAFDISVNQQVRLPGGATVVLSLVAGYLLVAGIRVLIDAVRRGRSAHAASTAAAAPREEAPA